MYLKDLMCISLMLLVWCCLPAPAAGQPAASISGQVTIGGRPVIGRKVLIARVRRLGAPTGPVVFGDPSEGGMIFSAVTDAEGRYQLGGLAAGDYEVSVTASGAYLLAGEEGRRFRRLTLETGKAARNIDLTLVRGATITGRLTDADGVPLIGTQVQLIPVDPDERGDVYQIRKFVTDDRGLYRAYGLPAGRYRVGSDGLWGDTGGVRASVKRHRLIYYPGTTEEAAATVLAVKEGEELAEIHLKLAPRLEMYEVTGRVFEAETDHPVSQVTIHCFGYDSANQPIMNYSSKPTIDAEGRFRFKGLPTGHYDLSLEFPEGQRHYYYEPLKFEVKEANVGGLELKLRRGATIRGRVVPDQDRNPALREHLFEVSVTADPQGNGRIESGGSSSLIDVDGSFSVTGLPPGITALRISNSSRERRFYVLRVERDDVDVSRGLEIKPGETIRGIRMTVAYGTGAIRGRLNLAGRTPPRGMLFTAYARNLSDPGRHDFDGWANVNEQGRFAIEGLIDGEYEVTVSNSRQSIEQPSFSTSKRVRVTEAAAPPLTVTVDLSRPRREEEQ
ncbi:MAG TPA: carboxypeptidase-like regulatory domain-containing protein [Blastocatellia bacterium]|nr:carboxypeptidase-like regulatory domain-containing protein [Blastocatellia bacterium]